MEPPPPPYQPPGPVVIVQPPSSPATPSLKCRGASVGVGTAQFFVGVAINITSIAILVMPEACILLFILPVCGPLLVISGLLGMAYGRWRNRGLAVADLVLSIITLIACIVPSFFGVWQAFFRVPLQSRAALVLETIGFGLTIASIVIASVVVCCTKPEDVQSAQKETSLKTPHPSLPQMGLQGPTGKVLHTATTAVYPQHNIHATEAGAYPTPPPYQTYA